MTLNIHRVATLPEKTWNLTIRQKKSLEFRTKINKKNLKF